MIVAHRGASHDAPENTLAAFREAWRQCADGIEGDFYFTRDQHIVCIHDKDTQRTGGEKLSVSGSTLSELRQLEYGKWKSPEFTGEPLPTLSDVLKEIPADKTFVIELKTGPDIVPLLAEQLKDSQASFDKLLIIAFDADTVAAAKQHLPDVRAHWLTSYKLDEQTETWHPTPEEICDKLKACNADGLGSKGDRKILTPEFIARLKELGMKEFHVWTIDDPQDARYFQEMGAVGITTNRPAFLREALELPEAAVGVPAGMPE